MNQMMPMTTSWKHMNLYIYYFLIPVLGRCFRSSYLPEHGGISVALLTGRPTVSLAVERISHGIFSRRW